MIAVVAGTYYQYQDFIRENNLNTKEYFYVSSFEKILGMRKLKYILYGTYYQRKDFDQINLRLKIAEFEELNKLEQHTTENMRLRLSVFTQTLLRKASHILKRCRK